LILSIIGVLSTTKCLMIPKTENREYQFYLYWYCILYLRL
jgi:hypothetical protein